MIYPSFLKKGDLIGISAPSAGVGRKLDSFDQSLGVLRKEGFRIRETESVRLLSDRGGSARQRGAELGELFADPDVSMVMAASGGDFLDEMLPFTDFDLMKRNPKWLMGASDPTGLLFPYTTLCDVATLYGNNAGSYDILAGSDSETAESAGESLSSSGSGKEGLPGKSPSSSGSGKEGLPGESPAASGSEIGGFLRDSLAILKGDLIEQGTSEMHLNCAPFLAEELKYDTPTVWPGTEKSVHVSGRCIGGCIDVLKDLIGTPYDGARDFVARYGERDGIIWYFDNFSLSAEVLYRTFLQMKYAGWFEHTKAILLGRTLFERSESGMTYEDAVRAAFGPGDAYGAEPGAGSSAGPGAESGAESGRIPVIWEMDIGHTIPHMTMINGAMLQFDYEDGRGKLKFSLE